MSERRTAAAGFPTRERADLAAAIAAHEKARSEAEATRSRLRTAKARVAHAERAAGTFPGAGPRLFSDGCPP
jgi:hypothetical protein